LKTVADSKLASLRKPLPAVDKATAASMNLLSVFASGAS